MMPSALGRMSYPGLSWPPTTYASVLGGMTGNVKSAIRAAQHQKRKFNDIVAAKKSSIGRKLWQIRVQPKGEIDGACLGKNGWDDAVKGLMPRILDISVVDWEAQNPKAMQKL